MTPNVLKNWHTNVLKNWHMSTDVIVIVEEKYAKYYNKSNFCQDKFWNELPMMQILARTEVQMMRYYFIHLQVSSVSKDLRLLKFWIGSHENYLLARYPRNHTPFLITSGGRYVFYCSWKLQPSQRTARALCNQAASFISRLASERKCEVEVAIHTPLGRTYYIKCFIAKNKWG